MKFSPSVKSLHVQVMDVYVKSTKKSLNFEIEHLYGFLMGLIEEFIVVRTQILSSSLLPTLNDAYHLVNQDEHQ